MENKPYKSITITGPKDRSLEAYKAWIMEMAMKLTTQPTEIRWTEEWITNWKKYWGKKPIE